MRLFAKNGQLVLEQLHVDLLLLDLLLDHDFNGEFQICRIVNTYNDLAKSALAELPVGKLVTPVDLSGLEVLELFEVVHVEGSLVFSKQLLFFIDTVAELSSESLQEVVVPRVLTLSIRVLRK